MHEGYPKHWRMDKKEMGKKETARKKLDKETEEERKRDMSMQSSKVGMKETSLDSLNYFFKPRQPKCSSG